MPCGPRASSTKTRIETAISSAHRCNRHAVQGRVPQKQGLKQRRTRSAHPSLSLRPRASSTKTRIETLWQRLVRTSMQSTVQGRVPQKQGLKHFEPGPNASVYRPVQGRVPQKQGLKHHSGRPVSRPHAVQGRVPQKQGLKQSISSREHA